jgi:hypothetical protein
MRKNFITTAVLLGGITLTLIPPVGAASKPKAGKPCTKLDEVQIFGSTAYRCTIKGSRLLWVSKKLTKAQLAAINGSVSSPDLTPIAPSTAAGPTATVAPTTGVAVTVASAPIATAAPITTLAPAPAPAASTDGPITDPKRFLASDQGTFKSETINRLGFPNWWPMPASFDPATTMSSISASDVYSTGAGTRSSYRSTDYFSSSLDLESIARALIAQIPASAGVDLAKVSTSTGTQNDHKYVDYRIGVTRAQVRITVGEVGPTGKPVVGSIATIYYSLVADAPPASVTPPTAAPALAQFSNFALPGGFTWRNGSVSMLAYLSFSASTSTTWAGSADLASVKAFYESAALPAGFVFKEVSTDRADIYVRKLSFNGLDGRLSLFATPKGTTVELIIDAKQK